LSKLLKLLKEYSRIMEAAEARSIARRMFVTNALDSLLSTIGILLGTYILGGRDPLVFYGAVVGGATAMGIFSAFLGTYLSERAERIRELREMERTVLRSLRGSIYWDAARMVPLYIAVWSSMGVLILPALCTSPLLAAHAGLLSLSAAIYMSLAFIEAALFLIGCYLGRISGEGMLKNGVRMLLIGLAASVMYLALQEFHESTII